MHTDTCSFINLFSISFFTHNKAAHHSRDAFTSLQMIISTTTKLNSYFSFQWLSCVPDDNCQTSAIAAFETWPIVANKVYVAAETHFAECLWLWLHCLFSARFQEEKKRQLLPIVWLYLHNHHHPFDPNTHQHCSCLPSLSCFVYIIVYISIHKI